MKKGVLVSILSSILVLIFATVLTFCISSCSRNDGIAEVLADKTICIDAGHGKNASNEKEPIAPGSTEKKAAFVSGTQGGGITEEELNLILALKLQEKLEAVGATVYMTRSGHETELSNIGRAEFSNEKDADLCVKIHADGSENKAVSGMTMLVPSEKYVGADIAEESRVAGEKVLAAMLEETGADSRGVVERSDMTGFNWSKVPVILAEVGFMTNEQECELLKSEEYQEKITDGITSGIINYFDSKDASYE